MQLRTRSALVTVGVLFPWIAFAASAPAPAPSPASAASPAANSRIASVTVYQSSALVGREVVVPEGAGNLELVVPTLPASTVQSSLYAQGAGEIRVLTTRYRSRPLAQTAAEDLRKLESQLRELQKAKELLEKQVEAGSANLELLGKLENFTQATMTQLTDKGLLNSETVTKLAAYIMDTRVSKSIEIVNLEQQKQANGEQQQFVQREIARLSNSSDKTSRDAVIVVDKADKAAGKVMLYYVVSAASWKPMYKVRAQQDKPQVDVEYLAAISQQTGEDWNGVDLTLSTAMPMFNAAPPELAVLEVRSVSMNAQNTLNLPPGMPGMGPSNAAVSIDGKVAVQRSSSNLRQQMQLKADADRYAASGQKAQADLGYNVAAAVAQADELVRDSEELKRERQAPVAMEGQSVTFHLDRRFTIPWRDDEQLIEVSRLALQADYLYKAVPVLTPHVYRLANLTNNSQQVILPGEATMYFGSDFVGRASLPLVAIGQTFTTGFGVDPQIQVRRQLVDKTRSVQGGNQVQKFDYRISIDNYKNEAVKLELWDRMPHAEGEAITTTLASSAPAISSEEMYVRDQQAKGLLRWDLTLAPATSGSKATSVKYEYKLEYAKDAVIGNIFNRQ